ncbi:putative lipoprotein, partial [Vibrio parahaemolyticus EKP-028]
NPASAGFFSAFKRAKVFIKDNIRASSHFNKPKKIIAKN